MALASSARSRLRWKAAICPAPQPTRRTCTGMFAKRSACTRWRRMAKSAAGLPWAVSRSVSTSAPSARPAAASSGTLPWPPADIGCGSGGRLGDEACEVFARQRAGVGDALKRRARAEREDELGHDPGRILRSRGGLLVQAAEHPGQPVNGVGVQLGIAPVQLRDARGMRTELDDEQGPLRLSLLDAVRQLRLGLGELPSVQRIGELVVLLGALGDPRLKQGKEHVRLALELRVDDALGEAGLLSDRVQRGARVTAGQEYPAGGRQHQLPVALDLLVPAHFHRAHFHRAHFHRAHFHGVRPHPVLRAVRPHSAPPAFDSPAFGYQRYLILSVSECQGAVWEGLTGGASRDGGPEMAKTLAIGATAPDFTLPGVLVTGGTAERGDYTLSAQRGKPVVLAFYPGDNTPVCTRQLCSYTSGLDAFTGLGAAVWGISPQDVDSHES